VKYRFTGTDFDSSPFASGSILFSRPGLVGFPARLASELYIRCARSLDQRREKGRHQLYDPCCGGGIGLTALALIHGDELDVVAGSDCDPDALSICERNLGLLSREGFDARIENLHAKHSEFGRPHYQMAALAAERLRDQLGTRLDSPPNTRLFVADAADPGEVKRGLSGIRPDIVVADLPYGVMSYAWRPDGPNDQTWRDALVTVLLEITARPAALALVSRERLRPPPETVGRWQHKKLGHRHILLVEV